MATHRSNFAALKIALILTLCAADNPYLCPANQYYSPGTKEPCLPCPTGTANATACLATDTCPMSRCAPKCKYNQYYLPPGDPDPPFPGAQPGCQYCPEGQVRDSACSSSAGCALKTCEMCPPGQYTPHNYFDCGGGGLPPCKCTLCPAGRYWVSASNGLPWRFGADDDFSPHTAFMYGIVMCPACPVGKYSATPGSLTCEACPAGKVSVRSSSSCSDACGANQYFNNASDAKAPCLPCPTGHYQRQRSNRLQ